MGRLIKKFVDFKLKFDSKLVRLVKQCPCLYDNSHPDHNNISRKTILWHIIGKYLHSTADFCEKRWLKIKKRFFEECLWAVKMGKEPLWLLFHQIDFLNQNEDFNGNFISSGGSDKQAMFSNNGV